MTSDTKDNLLSCWYCGEKPAFTRDKMSCEVIHFCPKCNAGSPFISGKDLDAAEAISATTWNFMQEALAAYFVKTGGHVKPLVVN